MLLCWLPVPLAPTPAAPFANPLAGYQPSASFTAGLVAAAAPHWPSFEARELSSLLFVLARWGAELPPEQLLLLEARVQREAARMDGHAVASLVWALRRWVGGWALEGEGGALQVCCGNRWRMAMDVFPSRRALQ